MNAEEHVPGSRDRSLPLSVEIWPVTREVLLDLVRESRKDQRAMAVLTLTLRQADIGALTARARSGTGEDAYLLALALQAHGSGKAARWLRTAAEVGVADAAYDLAGQIMGDNSKRNLKKALPWFKRAADGGHGTAAAIAATALISFGRDHWAEAERYLAIAAQAGHAESATKLGGIRLEQGDTLGAESWFEQAARAGDPEGANNYAVLLHRRDPASTEFLHWLQVAADGGHALAADNLRKIRAAIRDAGTSQ